MKSTILLFSACYFLFGCSHASMTVPPSLAGFYASGGFDIELRLRVNENGTYRETSWGPLIVLGPNGALPPETYREEGRVSLSHSELVLYSRDGERRVLRFNAAEPITLREQIRGRVREYKKGKEPNQTPQPTPPSRRG